MKLKNIPKRLSIKQPLSINMQRGGVKILGAGMKGSCSHIKIFRPIRPGGRRGGNGSVKKGGSHKGCGFGMIAASVRVPLLMNLINKL